MSSKQVDGWFTDLLEVGREGEDEELAVGGQKEQQTLSFSDFELATRPFLCPSFKIEERPSKLAKVVGQGSRKPRTKNPIFSSLFQSLTATSRYQPPRFLRGDREGRAS